MRGSAIAIYLPSLRGGGAERSMMTLANGFAERGYRIDLVLAQAEGPYMSEVHDSVRVVDLRAGRVIRSLPGLVRYLRRERPKALLSALNHANVIAVLAHRLAGSEARLVVSERNMVSLAAEDRTSQTSYLMRHLMSLTYRWADAVVTVSNGVRDDLIDAIGVPQDRVQTIYNPVVDEGLLTRAHEPIAHSWFAQGAPPVILGVGRLTPQKDFATLIRAFSLVRRRCDARLMILGEGELRSDLETLIQSLGLEHDVVLPGFADNPFQFMRNAAVFVLSSRWEGLPGVLIQAMACGTPVVSTNCPSGPAEILEDGRWGRLIPVGDVEGLAEAILATIDAEEQPNVTRRAQDFSVERAVQAYLEVLGLEV